MKTFLESLVCVAGAGLLILAGALVGGAAPRDAKAPAAMASAPASAPAVGAVGWRGDGSGVFKAQDPPVEWDQDLKKGILWSVKVGESRYGQPIAVGNKVFLLSEPDKLLCLDADSGKALWEKANGADQLPDNPEVRPPSTEVGNTTPCPVSDGKNVYAVFANGIAVCYDLDGNRKWIQYIAEPSTTEHGRSGSPVLAGDKLIMGLGMLTALETTGGKVAWKVEKVSEMYGSPVAAKVGDADVVVDPGGYAVRVRDGAILAKRAGSCSYASPVAVGDRVYYLDVESVAAQLLPKASDAIEVKKLWAADLEGEFYASGVVYGGVAYAVSDQGMLYALDAKDGKELWKQPLDIPSGSGKPGMPPGHMYPSLAVAGKCLYVTNDQGDTLVLQAGKEYKELKRNKVNEGSGANLFFAGKRAYLRGGEMLYCVGAK